MFVTRKMVKKGAKKAVAKEPKKAPANKAIAKAQKTPKETVTRKKEPLKAQLSEEQKKLQKNKRKTKNHDAVKENWNMSGGCELKVKCDPKAIIGALITDKVKGVAKCDVANWLGTTFLHFDSPQAAKKACQKCAKIDVWGGSTFKVKQGREPTVALARTLNGMVASSPSLCIIVMHVRVSFVIFKVRLSSVLSLFRVNSQKMARVE